MATTEQRPGFRLPWAGESTADTASTSPTDSVSPDAQPDGVVADGGASDVQDAQADPRIGLIPHDAGEPTGSQLGTTEWQTPDASTALIGAPGAGPQPSQRPAHVRPQNALVAGLVRAMREAAEAARQETLTKVVEDAKEQRERIQAESAGEDEALRQTSEHDIVEIRDWSKAQVARIKEETETRIAARRGQLELEAEDQAARVEHRLAFVDAAVETFEQRMEAFFQALMTEDDPARLAGYAEQMPEPPDFADEHDLATWTPSHALDSEDAAAAEAAALSDFESGTTENRPDAESDDSRPAFDLSERFAKFAGPMGSVAALADDAPMAAVGPSEESGDDSQADQPRADEVTADPEPASVSEDDGTMVSKVAVVGLISVAGIAGFKRAVARADGIEGISVASGPAGDFIFTIRHRQTVEVATVIRGLDAFSVKVKTADDGSLSVTASEPATIG